MVSCAGQFLFVVPFPLSSPSLLTEARASFNTLREISQTKGPNL